MNKKKANIIGIAILVLIGILLTFIAKWGINPSGWFLNPNNIKVTNDNISIKSGIESNIYGSENKKISVSIKNILDIDEEKIVSFTYTEEATRTATKSGYSSFKLTKGNLYQLTYSRLYEKSTTKLVEQFLVNTNNGQYLINIFKKYNMKPQKIKFSINDKKFEVNVPSTDYGFQYQKVEEKFEVDKFSGSSVSFFDDQNNDITHEIKVVD